MKKPLHVLIVEDSPDDAAILLGELRRAGFDPQWKRVELEEDFLAGLKEAPEIVISDYSMPEFDGLRAAKLLHESGLNIPFILVSGTVGEDVAVEAMKHGATDYLLKDRLARLGHAVDHALEENRLRAERKRNVEETRFQKLLLEAQSEALIDGILTVDANANIISFNRRFVEMWGISAELVAARSDEPVLMSVVDRIVDGQQFLDRVRYLYEHRDLVSREEILLKDGRVFDRHTSPVKRTDGAYYGRIWTFRDITGHKQAEEELRQREDDLAEAQRVARLGSWRYDITSNKVRWSDELYRIFDIEKTCFAGTHEAFLNRVLPGDRSKVLQMNAEATAHGTPYQIEYCIHTRAGDLKTIQEIGRAKKDAGGRVVELFGIAQDITLRKQTDEEIRTQLDELRRWHEVTLGREDRILELKSEVNTLLAKLGQPSRYSSPTP